MPPPVAPDGGFWAYMAVFGCFMGNVIGDGVMYRLGIIIIIIIVMAFMKNWENIIIKAKRVFAHTHYSGSVAETLPGPPSDRYNRDIFSHLMMIIIVCSFGIFMPYFKCHFGVSVIFVYST